MQEQLPPLPRDAILHHSLQVPGNSPSATGDDTDTSITVYQGPASGPRQPPVLQEAEIHADVGLVPTGLVVIPIELLWGLAGLVLLSWWVGWPWLQVTPLPHGCFTVIRPFLRRKV